MKEKMVERWGSKFEVLSFCRQRKKKKKLNSVNSNKTGGKYKRLKV